MPAGFPVLGAFRRRAGRAREAKGGKVGAYSALAENKRSRFFPEDLQAGRAGNGTTCWNVTGEQDWRSVKGSGRGVTEPA